MVAVKPIFQSEIDDDPVAEANGEVTPSRWNEGSVITQASGRVLGRVSADAGETEELTATQLRGFANVQDGATANATDAQLRDRGTHTGAQEIATVTGLQQALDDRASSAELAAHVEDDTRHFTPAEKTKLGHIAISQAVDLDAIESRVNQLDAAVVLVGVWDASTGSFPGGGAAQAGQSWIVSAGGTVDGVEFSVDDRVIAIADNASTATYAGNWHKADYTDRVNTVAGRTGNVTLGTGDIDGLGTAASEDVGDFATAAQGAKADSAVQPAALGALAQADLSNVTQAAARTKVGTGTMAYRDAYVITADPSGSYPDGTILWQVD